MNNTGTGHAPLSALSPPPTPPPLSLHPTRSRGMRRREPPCFRNTAPEGWDGLTPTPSSVMMADVAAGTLNSSAANRRTAVKGASSGTLKL